MSYKIKSIARLSPLTTRIVLSHSSTPRDFPLILPNLFLKDACVRDVDPQTRQRLFRTGDLSRTSEIVGFGEHDYGGERCVVLEWRDAAAKSITRAASLSVVPLATLLDQLRAQRPDLTLSDIPGIAPGIPLPAPWDGGLDMLRVPYAKFNPQRTQGENATGVDAVDSDTDRPLLTLVTALLRSGIALVTDIPSAEKSGQRTELFHLASRIGSIRRTWYGDLFDVRAERDSKNIAYTNLDLGLHGDLIHFETPPRFQLLHCLENENVTGGESYFVDAFRIAEEIRRTRPELYDVLQTMPVCFDYDNGGKHTRFIRPVLEEHSGHLWAVNYAPPFQGLLPLTEYIEEELGRAAAVPGDGARLAQGVAQDPQSTLGSNTQGSTGADSTDSEASSPDPPVIEDLPASEIPLATAIERVAARMDRLHEALALFDTFCGSPEFQIRHQLQAGECVVFDNRRVLHARTEFNLAEDGSSSRWLKGAYIDGDEVWSRFRVLSQEQEHAKKAKESLNTETNTAT